MKIRLFGLLIIGFLFNCKNQKGDEKPVQAESVSVSTKDIEKQEELYVGKEIYAGDELENYSFIQSEELSAQDSLYYSVYHRNDESYYLISIEKMIANEDVEQFKIIDNFKLQKYDPNIYKVRFSKTNEACSIFLHERESVLKKWSLECSPEDVTNNSAATGKIELQQEGNDLYIKRGETVTVLKDVLRNEMSLSSYYKVLNQNDFVLAYESNSSATKSVEKYRFHLVKEKVKLVSKEVVKFGREGISDNYFTYSNRFVDDQWDYEQLSDLEQNAKEIFTKNPIIRYQYKDSKLTAEIPVEDITPEQYFVQKSK